MENLNIYQMSKKIIYPSSKKIEEKIEMSKQKKNIIAKLFLLIQLNKLYNLFIEKLQEFFTLYRKMEIRTKEELEFVYKLFQFIYGIMVIIESQLLMNIPKAHYELKEKIEEEIDSLKFSLEHYEEFQEAVEFIKKIDDPQNR